VLLNYIKRLCWEFKEVFLELINSTICPFSPEDNPFPQCCDKRKMFTDECFQCPWYVLAKERKQNRID
jgi:hypothetical protein